MNFRFYLLYAVLFFIGLSSCTKNDSTTLIPMGDESYFKDIEEIAPPDVMSFINNDLRGYVNNAQVITMGGWYPAKVEGDFRIDPCEYVYSTIDLVGVSSAFYNINLKDQHNGVVSFEMEFDSLFHVVDEWGQEFDRHVISSYSSDTIYVRGDGENITMYGLCDVYFSNTMYFGEYVQSLTAQFSSLIVIVGRITEIGIENIHVFEYVNDIISYSPDAYQAYFDNYRNSKKIFKSSGDGIAPRINVNEE